MKTLIVDDEPLAIAHLEHLLGSREGVSLIGSAQTGLSALHMFEGRRPDLVLVDVEMPGMDGVSMAQEMCSRRQVQIIFISAYDHYAASAFDVEATDYVLKPVEPCRLYSAIGRAQQRLLIAPVVNAVNAAASQIKRKPQPLAGNENIPVYWAKTDRGMVRIEINEISHVTACKDYAYIHLKDRQYMIRETMIGLEKSFHGTALMRTHRSHIVNINHVMTLSREGSNHSIKLKGEIDIPLGRHYFDAIKSKLSLTT